MRISELSKRSGVSVPTIKYYLREHLLPPGAALRARDAEYGDDHLERLEIIRNLRDIAQLPIETIKRLVLAADNPQVSLPMLAGIAHSAVLPPLQNPLPSDDELSLAAEFYAELNWILPQQHPLFHHTARLLSLLKKNGGPYTAEALAPYVQAVSQLADFEVGETRSGGSRLLLVHDVVVGTALSQQLLVILHMSAQVNQALNRLSEQSSG